MLTQDQVVPYLIERRLVKRAQVVDANLRITRAARRNQNFLVEVSNGASYFLKQSTHETQVGCIANEAAAYRAIQSHGLDRLERYVPRCFFYDEERGVLVLEAIRQAQDLHQYHMQSGRFPKRAARDLGLGLGALHESTKGWSERGGEAFSSDLPTVFRVIRPPLDILKIASSVDIDLIKLVQRHDAFGAGFESLSRQWRRDTLIHGDVKLWNFLVERGESTRPPRVRIIDWEFASYGDARWDVGSVFASYLSLWLLSVPIARGDEPDRLLHLARYPLARMQPAFEAFWRAYCQVRQFGSEARDWLVATMRAAAACLVQAAYERSKVANYLTAEILALAQMSLNIFQQPELACRELLNISVD